MRSRCLVGAAENVAVVLGQQITERVSIRLLEPSQAAGQTGHHRNDFILTVKRPGTERKPLNPQSLVADASLPAVPGYVQYPGDGFGHPPVGFV